MRYQCWYVKADTMPCHGSLFEDCGTTDCPFNNFTTLQEAANTCSAYTAAQGQNIFIFSKQLRRPRGVLFNRLIHRHMTPTAIPNTTAASPLVIALTRSCSVRTTIPSTSTINRQINRLAIFQVLYPSFSETLLPTHVSYLYHSP